MESQMKNKYFATAVTLALLTASSFSYGQALHDVDTTTNVDQNSHLSPKEQSRLSGTIKSQANLDQYQALSAPLESPLNRLLAASLKRFLDSLTFNEKGLTGFSYIALQRELSATEVHQVLSLFGAQHTTSMIRGAEVRTELDQEVMSGAFFIGKKKFTPTSTINLKSWPPLNPWDWGSGTDYPVMWCSSRAACSTLIGSICMSSC